MHENYADIKKRIPDKPVWYDSNGTPRYDAFHPDCCPDIYSRDVFLLRIACQHCGMEFNVELHSGLFDVIDHQAIKRLHYGDPPIHGCTGDTMNCDDLTIAQVWTRRDGLHHDWVRHPELEGEIT